MFTIAACFLARTLKLPVELWQKNFSIFLNKLKTHVVRKREIYSKERFKDKENF